MPAKEFRIIIVRKLGELQKNADKQFNKIGKAIYDLNEKFNKDNDIIKKKKKTRSLGVEHFNKKLNKI